MLAEILIPEDLEAEILAFEANAAGIDLDDLPDPDQAPTKEGDIVVQLPSWTAPPPAPVETGMTTEEKTKLGLYIGGGVLVLLILIIIIASRKKKG